MFPDQPIGSASLETSLRGLVRGNASTLSGVLRTSEKLHKLEAVNAQVRIYHLQLDDRKSPVLNKLVDLLTYRILDFAVPRARLAKAREADTALGDGTMHLVQLHLEARKLFVKSDGTGEPGELLLATLAEFVLGYPQVLAKMSLKTNSNVHVHGCDGIHVTINEHGHLSLCWGESKLIAREKDAIRECMSSLSQYLADSAQTHDNRTRDLILLNDGAALEDPAIATALAEYLDTYRSASVHLQHRGVCLIGFDAPIYNAAKVASDFDITASADRLIDTLGKYIASQVAEGGMADCMLDVFLLPLPAVSDFRKIFAERLTS